MRRLGHVLVVLIVLGLFGLGYWSADLLEERRIWQEDSRMARPELRGEGPAAAAATEARTSGVVFEDVALRSGLDFTYHDGAEGKLWIMESTGGGMAVLDYDGNGLQDVYLVDGCRLPVDPSDRRTTSRLFRGGGDPPLEDVSEPAGTALVAYGQGAAAGDYDNDGFDDLVVTSFGRNVLYHNEGDGTFRDVTAVAGVSSNLWGTSAAFSDLDGDGVLDLYVCTYADVPLETPRTCLQLGTPVHCAPLQYRAQPDLLFRNRGDGRFDESSGEAGIRDENGRGLALAIADLDGDDRPDIFVANDTSEHLLFVNRGGFRFEEAAARLGVALTGTGSTMQGMGVACADYNLDGAADLFVTDFYGEKNVLFENIGTGGFVDVADAAGLGLSSRDRLAFGAIPIDADLDGAPDLFVANGHVDDLTAQGIPFRMRQQFYHNRGRGRFDDESSAAGAYFLQPLLGRGVAAVDIDNDGAPDIVVSHIGTPVALLANRTPARGHWLGLQLVGTRSARNGLNVRVELTVGELRRVVETVSGGGYLSSSDKRLLVGLGTADTATELTVRWPSGRQQTLRSLPADAYYRVVEPVSP